MTKQYYKVVSPSTSIKLPYQSCRMTDYSVYHSLTCYYQLDEWTHPIPGSKLMVFDYLIYARNFRCANEIVFECEVQKPSKRWGGIEAPFQIFVFY